MILNGSYQSGGAVAAPLFPLTISSGVFAFVRGLEATVPARFFAIFAELGPDARDARLAQLFKPAFRRIAWDHSRLRAFDRTNYFGTDIMQHRFLTLIPLVLASGLALTGCLRTAIVATGSAVASTAGAAAGAVGGLATSSVSSVASAATPSGTISSTTSAPATGSLEAGAQTPQGAAAQTAMVAGGEAVLVQQVNALSSATAATTPEASIAEGADSCLKAASSRVNAAENLTTYGWQGAKSADEIAKSGNKSQSINKLGVRGTILPSGSCVFRADSVALSTLTQSMTSYLEENFEGSLTVGSPHGRTGACDGYTINAPSIKAWVYFTNAKGDHCSKSSDGSGLTVKLL